MSFDIILVLLCVVVFPKILSFSSPFSCFSSLLPQDYKRSTGDTIIRYSCVSVSMLQTDTILDTEADVDSSLLGVRFYVFVNETIQVFFLFFFCFSFFFLSFFFLFSLFFSKLIVNSFQKKKNE